MADFTFGRKLLFLAKNAFLPYKHPKIAKGLVFILEKDTFLFAQLFPVVARTWCPARSGCFLWAPKSQFLAQNSDFCHSTPNFVNVPFLTPLEGRFISNLGIDFSTFCFPVIRVKKSSSSLLWGHSLPVTALALSARGLDDMS